MQFFNTQAEGSSRRMEVTS